MSSSKRSSSTTDEAAAGAKRSKGGVADAATIKKDDHGGDGCKGGPESLAILASRAAERFFNGERVLIPWEARDHFATRRRRLQDELNELRREEEEYTTRRMKALEKERTRALEQMKVAGGPDQYCRRCNRFYFSAERSTMKCSVVGCDVHARCPICDDDPANDDDGASDADDESKKSWSHEDECAPEYDCWEENNADGTSGRADFERSPTGYTECWICKSPFCNKDFERHYDRCRAKASLRCGFRPPTGANDNKRYVCVPGHCGKVLNKKDRHICYPDDYLCCTVSCDDCIAICHNKSQDDSSYGGYDSESDYYYRYGYKTCGTARCKLHASSCYGSCDGW